MPVLGVGMAHVNRAFLVSLTCCVKSAELFSACWSAQSESSPSSPLVRSRRPRRYGRPRLLSGLPSTYQLPDPALRQPASCPLLLAPRRAAEGLGSCSSELLTCRATNSVACLGPSTGTFAAPPARSAPPVAGIWRDLSIAEHRLAGGRSNGYARPCRHRGRARRGLGAGADRLAPAGARRRE